jgi:hypothetical protein
MLTRRWHNGTCQGECGPSLDQNNAWLLACCIVFVGPESSPQRLPGALGLRRLDKDQRGNGKDQVFNLAVGGGPIAGPFDGRKGGQPGGFRRYTTCSPGCHSPIANLNGPEPTTSLICSSAGVDAIRAGIMKGTLLDGVPSASSTEPKRSPMARAPTREWVWQATTTRS